MTDQKLRPLHRDSIRRISYISSAVGHNQNTNQLRRNFEETINHKYGFKRH